MCSARVEHGLLAVVQSEYADAAIIKKNLAASYSREMRIRPPRRLGLALSHRGDRLGSER